MPDLAKLLTPFLGPNLDTIRMAPSLTYTMPSPATAPRMVSATYDGAR